MPALKTGLALLALATSTYAQYFGGYTSGSDNPYSSSSSSSDTNGDGSSTFGGQSSGSFGGFGGFGQYNKTVTAHAVLAALAFGFFFPVGGIVIRLASFRGLWLVHGLFQIFAYLLYIAGAGIGLWMISARRQLLHDPHPIIGIILLVLIFFQPFLGFLHHFMFKKHSRRVVWSYGHIWLGRIIITLGIINGGLGLRLARRAPVAPPSRGAIIGYSVVAGLIWLVYVVSAIVGERKRGRVVMVRETEGHGKEYESSRSREHSREQYA
ncbi:hypothetical protein CLAFUW4_00214 [Fulvia fulva]|uniref:Cytochrome b561 domain-containing protein n=1 Tax=Passalora fulva TaxID=5499 RepID=A0A9Q8L6K2_PASFU|nr:uncharacterized protein CLAFUR5_00214 [Fulvia fulva]KAK4635558.1 hypothetical protein CLAFUR4_00214 [Fulvia fulva]KAK4638163.1 hypothetical protein CLAFUR0_00215 [Fulvia fulva]UJO11811.1 hypothetical protein CLAFUR5_00214 [Fulvia fulva]WPV09530.1 hypothetical protein CLAFUW4_00214 [Fulvia fulva]WPV24417.1 hypothetical protein CLAFUW7_00217 [Fulvia fulva]